ncbi:unnamed protein product [Rotaria socialis]|uniref:Uncharacterized protein n=1 Tax=Rotaria socialis TaxID=392032 RepID=A0A818H579_9BILA|nr:unnamed protein product [Rotaria socialis]
MEKDSRYQWLESRLIATLEPKRDALVQLIQNDDNRLSIEQFLENEDITHLYILSQSSSHLLALNAIPIDFNSYQRIVLFIKTNLANKLSRENLDKDVALIELYPQETVHYMDIISRDVYLPLLSCNLLVSDIEKDRFLDLFHRLLNQTAATHTIQAESIVLPLPAFNILAHISQQEPERQQSILSILENTLTNWSKQIKQLLQEELKPSFYSREQSSIKDQVQLWTSRINKLNNLLVQLDSPFVQDVLKNLARNRSPYLASFMDIKIEITRAVTHAERNLSFVSTLSPWIFQINNSNNVNEILFYLPSLMHTLFLIWQHSHYYHQKDKYSQLLEVVSSEIVLRAKQIIANNISSKATNTSMSLKDALSICAMFRGTYLDYKEKADALNSKYMIPEKKIDPSKMLIWHVNPYGENDPNKDISANNDPYSVLRKSSPWPPRNAKCFQSLNALIERCNDVQELTSTISQFNDLSATARVGGTLTSTMDAMLADVQLKSSKSLEIFHNECPNLSHLMDNDRFDLAFFRLRTELKHCEHELAWILRQCFSRATTLSSKLTLLNVFHGAYQRDVVQRALQHEQQWIIDNLKQEFQSVSQLVNSSFMDKTYSHWPPISRQLLYLNGLKQRIDLFMTQFIELCPKILNSDIGWELKEAYRIAKDKIQRSEDELYSQLEQSATSQISDLLLQPVFKTSRIYNDKDSIERIVVNIDNSLECLLREIRYITGQPLNSKIPSKFRELIPLLDNDRTLRLNVERLRSIATSYNYLIEHMELEEKLLFEPKLNRIDQIINRGLNEITWKSIHLSDYIEQSYGLINLDAAKALEIVQHDVLLIKQLAYNWSQLQGDIFNDNQLSTFQQTLEKHKNVQLKLNEKLIIDGHRIHALVDNIAKVVAVSSASPSWLNYLDYLNSLILEGIKATSLISMKNMFIAMTNENHQVLSIVVQLNDCQLSFDPPLVPLTSEASLGEILLEWIYLFINRGDLIDILGYDKLNKYSQLMNDDSSIVDLRDTINNLIEETCSESLKLFEAFSQYSFLYQLPVNQSFQLFLNGDKKVKSATPKNFLNEQDAGRRSVYSMGSIPTAELIDHVERSFLCATNDKQDLQKIPLLQEFENEMKIYQACLSDLSSLPDCWNVQWVRIDLKPIKQTLTSLSHKWLWKFCDYLHNQTSESLNNVDGFLGAMEPEIESITGLERDTETFMKIMRLFNSVSGKQQEVEIRFELMRRTLSLLKIYSSSNENELILHEKYQTIINRWQNLKTKVMQAKQRLGPTLKEESKLIMQDLKSFQNKINQLILDLNKSNLFQHQLTFVQAQSLLNEFLSRQKQLDKQALDYKQLQTLLDTNVVDFSTLDQFRETLKHLTITWKTVKDIRHNLEEIKQEQWQKLDSKQVLASCDKHLDNLQSLPKLARIWDIFSFTEDHIKRIKICAQLLDDLSNSALRTRHWKQLIRLTGGNTLMDSDTFRQLTFGKLFTLSFQDHADEIRATVKRAEKDFQLESTLKTYEEIWLSKTFQMIPYQIKQNNEQRRSVSTNLSSTNKKSRVSIGSISQSLLNIDISTSDKIHLLSNLDKMFIEIEDHQVNLEILQTNQSAGSFLDEISKWQTTLQHIEAVLKQWNCVQQLWLQIDCLIPFIQFDSQVNSIFSKADRDFRILMISVSNNNNVLKCCQKKNILPMLKYLTNQLNKCQQSLRKQLFNDNKQARLALLNDIQLFDLLSSGYNIQSLSNNLCFVIPGLKHLLFSDENKDEAIGLITEHQNEKILFTKSVPFEGNIQLFIDNLLTTLKETIKNSIDMAIQELTENNQLNILDWLMKYPRQTVVIVLKIIFTRLIEQYSKENQSQQKLSELTKTMLEEIKNMEEKSNDESLLINKKESLRKLDDVLTILSSYLIRIPIDLNSFEWLFTLKYYSNPQTKQISIQSLEKSINYGYDFVENKEMFTPREHDFIGKIFLSLGSPGGTFILNQNSDYLMENLSSNIGRALFRIQCDSIRSECEIINCFIGLCQGNFLLFNHVNKLNKNSLHLFIQLSSILYETVIKKNQSFEYLSKTYTLADYNEINYFSTIYPQAIENFSSLKSDIIISNRIITLTRPDYSHLLMSHLIQSGFHHAFQLTTRFINLIYYIVDQSLTENISQNGIIQSNIDLNPILIKILIKYSKKYLNSNKIEDEEKCLYTGLSILSKCFSSDDKKCFDSLISNKSSFSKEIYLKTLPLNNSSINNRYLNENIWNISDAFELSLNQFNLNINETILKKLFQLNNLTESHSKILIIGKSQYGKTLLIKTFIKAKSFFNSKQIYHHIMLQLWSSEDLFSKYDSQNNIFQKGLLNNIIENNKENLYLHLDGFNPNDLHSIEDFILNLDQSSHLFWELENLNDLSPLFLSSCVMLNIEEQIWTWKDFVLSNFSNKTHNYDIYQELEKILIDYTTKIESYDMNDKTSINISFISKVSMTITLLKNYLKNDKCSLIDLRPLVEFTLLWSFITHIQNNSRKQFENWWRQTFHNIPKEKSITDWMYDIDSHQFVLWSDTIPAFNPPAHQGIPNNIFVHTPYTMALSHLISSMSDNDHPVLLIGERGVGKTSLISDRLKATCGGDISDVFYVTINCNAETDGLSVYEKIEEQLQWKHSSYFTTKGNRKMFCFVDDLNLAKIDRCNDQSLVELLRQHIDSNGLYSPSNSKWQHIDNITYVVTINSSNSLLKLNRLTKHFHIIQMDMANQFDLVSIFSKLMNRHFIGDNGESQLINKDSNENPTRISTGKSSTITSTTLSTGTATAATAITTGTTTTTTKGTPSTTTTASDRPTTGTTTTIGLKEKLSSSTLKRLEYLRSIVERIVKGTVELNDRMRNMFQITNKRIHYVFSMKQLTQLFRNLSISLTPECSIDDLLYLWHHECDWIYGKRLFDQIDQQRYQQLYQTIVKKYFTNMINEQHALISQNQLFSNLQVTESGMVVANLSRDSQNYLTDNYNLVTDENRIEALVRNSIIEYNKEKPKISFPLYPCYIELLCRLCHTIQTVDGHCCIMAEGVLDPSIIDVFASIVNYQLVSFKTSHLITSDDRQQFFIKQKLTQTYIDAGIRNEKIILLITEEEFEYIDLIIHVTNLLNTEEMSSLFSLEEETSVLNSVRTQVQQAGLSFSRAVAWEFFLRNVKENVRVLILMNEINNKLCLDHPSIFNNISLIYWQHWDTQILVQNSLYHLKDVQWLDKTSCENTAHLLASMHLSIRRANEDHTKKLPHINNHTFTKFVEKFVTLFNEKSANVYENHCDVQRLLEQIQYQHETASKLEKELQHEKTVLEERLKSTERMLVQIGQDMVMAEQQIRAHKSQTRRTVQLKRLLPEYELTQEKNLYKCLAIATDARKLIESLDMKSLQELRSITKAEQPVEDTLAAVIMILKSPTADVTWQKGAKRQMANLDRFIEETHLFDKVNLTEEQINLINGIIDRVHLEDKPLNQSSYHDAVFTLYKWVKRVLQYHTILLKKVKPLHKKCKEIEQDVLEQDQKLILLDNKSQALEARLKDLSQNFEEATVDKKDQEEKVLLKETQLKTASQLNEILSRELERTSKIFESSAERQTTLIGTCSIGSAFLIYLGPYPYSFRRLMLTSHWIKCIRDRGMTIVFDQISCVKGRIINWQLNTIQDEQNEINEEQKLISGSEYRPMLYALIEFLLGDQMYLEWLSKGVLSSEMENHTIIVKSIEYPPLIIDPFGQADQWIQNYYNAQTIDFDDESNHEIVMSIEQSFLSGSKIYIKNCNLLDSLIYPLAQWKSTSQKLNTKDDTNLIIYCGRRLFCHPSFRFFIQTEFDSLEKVSSSLSLMTTCINCQYSVETLLDDLRQKVFQRIQPTFYQRKLSILSLILICQQRIQLIDSFLKLNSISDGFEGEQVLLTSVALERKYLLGEVIEQCYELLDSIEVYVDCYFPYAQHGALLYSVVQRINLLSRNNYKFSINIIYNLIDELFPLNNQTSTEDKQIWKDIEDTQHPQLPLLIEINDLTKEEFSSVDQKQIDENIKQMIQSFIKIILPQLFSEDRLEFLVLLQLLLKTAVENSDGKSEIFQIELLATGLPRINFESLSYSSTLSKKPQWIESDLIWFDIVSLSSLFNQDDLLYHLSEFILLNDQQWKSWYDNPKLNSLPNPNDKQYSLLDKLLIIRLLHPDHLMISLQEYVIEQFDLNNLQINDIQFQGVNIINLPSISVKSSLPGEFLINKIDFDNYLENVLKETGKKIRQIDCQLIKTIDDINDEYEIIFFKNIHQKSFSRFIKQIRRQCRSDILLTKEACVDFIYLDARIHHYDCLIEGKGTLSKLLYKNSNNSIRLLIGQIISSCSSILIQCQKDELTLVYGSILIQSILVYYQEIFQQSSFSLQWTRNLSEFILNLHKNTKEKKYLRNLIEMGFPSQSPLLTKLLNELFQQIESKSSIRLNECQFEIPQNESQFNLQWFLSKHPQINLIFNDYPSKLNSLQQQFSIFTEKINKLWHDKSENIYEKFQISLIHDNIHLFKERLPPLLKLPSTIDFKRDLVNIALYQEILYFNKQLELISNDINQIEDMLSYENLLLDKNQRFKSIGYDLQRNKIPLSWLSNNSSAPKFISIVQFIHQCRHRFNEYYSWINSFKDVEKIDSHCIHRSCNFIELMCLSHALNINLTRDKIRCIGQWAASKDKKISSPSRHLILNGLTIINGIIEDNNRIKSISGTINTCPSIEICATESFTDSYQCPVYAIPSSRLDPPLFYLLINEQIDPMTYIVFQNDNEDIGKIPFPTVIRQEPEMIAIINNENSPPREMSPTSQLSQSSSRTNTPSVKDIRRDEPMLGF